MADMNYIDSQTAQGYQKIRSAETSGSGFASTQQPSWEQQQAFSRQQELLSAQESAKIDASNKKRIAWTPKGMTPSKGMRKGK